MSKKQNTQPSCCNSYDLAKLCCRQRQLIEVDMKPLNLRKSIFFPRSGIIKSYTFRKYIIGAEVPLIDIIHSNPRWLLLQSENLTPDFFQKLNSQKFGNPYNQLYKVFKSFNFLLKVYGYFRVNAQMIFINKDDVKVWINADVFSDQRMLPLDNGNTGEKQFVQSFFTMVQQYLQEWEIVKNLQTIVQGLKLLKSRSRLIKRNKTVANSCKICLIKSNMSILPFETSQVSRNNIISNSYQEIQSYQKVNEFKPHISCISAKEDYNKKQQIQLLNKEMNHSSDLNTSILAYKSLRSSNQFRRTNKKFALTSTSSTIGKFSQKWRSTGGKKMKKEDKIQGNEIIQMTVPSPRNETTGIQNQLQGLFEDENKEFQLGVEPDNQSLQRIAEQMQQVLIW